MSGEGITPLPSRDPLLDADRLSEPDYFAETRARYERAPGLWAWYLREHSHKCAQCGGRVTHTGLEATRDGPAAHQCCGRDVRL